MSYQVFARKYRPRTFADVLGQDHVVQTLCNAIEQNRLAHAYLFVGPRGTGKTSTSRIFAKALNCSGGPRVDFDPDEDICQEIAEGRSLDVLEIDGASNRGIDNIRDLRDNVQFAPARGSFRIIYIDEVHMLTKESFNALLKTLEEPPAHVKFIFATTEPHKILPTILSRCQRFDLRPIPADVIAKHLVHIAMSEGVQLSEAAAYGIARVADGGMRDAQSMLDQLVSFCGNSIDEDHVNDIFGVTSRSTVAQALCLMLDRQLPTLLHLIHGMAETGRDIGQLLSELMSAVRELLISKVAPEETRGNIPEEWREQLSTLVAATPSDKLIRLMDILSLSEERMRWSTNKRLHLEMGLIQAVHSLAEFNISDVIRALNGAPLPETPIATSVLPQINYEPAPVSGAPVSAPPVVSVPAPEPVVEMVSEPVQVPEPMVEPVQEVVQEPAAPVAMSSLEPIDDAPPSFAQVAPPAQEPPSYSDDEPFFEPDFEPESDSQFIQAPRSLTPELWAQCLERVSERAPLQSGEIGPVRFVEDLDGALTIAINPANTVGRDVLSNQYLRGIIVEEAESLAHRQVSIRLVPDESVALPELAEILPPPPIVVAEPVAPKPAAPALPTPKPEPAPEKKLDEDFYKDPLIELALKEFHARIIQS